MPNTDRMNWPYPSENQDPWWEAFKSLMQGQDASGYAAREDRHIILFGGGTMTFTAATGLLTWASEINILAAISGFKWYIPIGSISLSDGDAAYVDLSRYPTTNTSLAVAKATQVPNTDSALIICIRIGDRVFFRNGRSIDSGSSFALLEIETGSGGGGIVPLAKGDLVTHDGVTPVLATVGADGTVPTANAAAPNGWAWTVPSGGGVSPYPEAGSGPDPYLRYLSTSGDDLNDGETLLTAWRSPGKVEAWLKTLINHPTTVVVDGDFSIEPVKYLQLHGVKTVEGGSLLICGILGASVGDMTYNTAAPSPNDPSGRTLRVSNFNPAPPFGWWTNIEKYLVRIDAPFIVGSSYAVVMDYDVSGQSWIDISCLGMIPAPGHLYFYDTTSNLEIRLDSCDGDAPPDPAKRNIAVVGLRTNTGTTEGNRVNGCNGVVLAAMFPEEQVWVFEDCSFLSIGYFPVGNPIVDRMNTYFLPNPISTSTGQAGTYGFVGSSSGFPSEFYMGCCSDIFWGGVALHRFRPMNNVGGSPVGANRGLEFRYCCFADLRLYWDGAVYLESSYLHAMLQIYKSRVFYDGLYFHSSFNSDTFSATYAIKATDSEITAGDGIRIGDPLTALVSCQDVFYLENTVHKFKSGYNFGDNDVIDCLNSVWRLFASKIIGDAKNGTSLQFANGIALRGSATPLVDACVVMDKCSEINVKQITFGNAYSVGGQEMPIVRGADGSRIVCAPLGVDLNSAGGGQDFGPEGAIVLIGGGCYVEISALQGTNTNLSAIVLRLDKGARGYHPGASPGPVAGSNLYLGGAGSIPYPLTTANDLAGPATSELCVLSR